MKITDEMLAHAAPHACALWLDTVADAVPHQTASRRFEQQMERLLRRPHGRIGVRTLLIAALIAAFLTMTAGAELLPPVRAFRSGVVDVLSQVFPKSTDQIYTTDADHEGETRRPVLGWLPEGMVEVDRNELSAITRINFENNHKKELYIFTQRLTSASNSTASLDTEDALVKTIFINDSQALISVKEETTIIEWCIDNYICSVIGTISTDEVLKVAEHIELK